MLCLYLVMMPKWVTTIPWQSLSVSEWVCRIDQLSSMRRRVASALKSAVRQSFITDDFRSRLIDYRAGPDGFTNTCFRDAQAFELLGEVNLRMSYRVVSSLAQLRPQPQQEGLECEFNSLAYKERYRRSIELFRPFFPSVVAWPQV